MKYFVCFEGTASMLIGGKWIDAEKGTFIRISSKTIHDLETIPIKKAEIWIFFIPTGIERNIPSNVQWFDESK